MSSLIRVRFAALAIATMISSVATAATVLAPIKVIACPAGYTGDYPDCKKPIDGGGLTHAGTPIPPSGGGASEPPPPACQTGNPIVDTPAVQTGFKNLWKESNTDDVLFRRSEHFGWIVYRNGSYYVYEWPIGGTYAGLCNGIADISGFYPPEGPGAIVAFVHTHPYQNGENVVNCEGSVVTYEGVESSYDRDASGQISTLLGRTQPLPGYVIDKDGISAFEGNKFPAGTWKWPRCGY
jgi:hypothetical protein